MAASYPGALWSPTVKTDKVDLVDDDHINRLQEEVVAVQTELGVNVAGSATDLVARLARALADSGAIAQGTSFPTSPTPVDGQMFYRTDQNVLYVYNGSTWDAQGQSLSATVFQYGGVDQYDTTLGELTGVTSLQATSGNGYRYLGAETQSSQALRTIWKTKFKKLAGMQTITVYGSGGSAAGGSVVTHVDIGGQTGESTAVGPSQTAFNFTVDVSSLTDGTVYDVTVKIKSGSASTHWSYVYWLIAFAS